MSSDIIEGARKIQKLVEELDNIDTEIVKIDKVKNRITYDKFFNNRNNILNSIENENTKLINALSSSEKVDEKKPLPKPQLVLPKPKKIVLRENMQSLPLPNFSSSKFKKLNSQEKKKYLNEINLTESELNKFKKREEERIKSRGKMALEKEFYTIYKPNDFAKIANKFMKGLADNLVEKYPEFFKPMFKYFNMVELDLLSRSYVSMMLFFTLLSFPGIFLFFLALNFAFNLNILVIALISFFGMIFTFAGFYFYPASLIGGKNQKIKLELPFALVHMSAVAGSGAQPISIFQLIVESDEYPELKKEIKKILNYVNLFGYNLTTALAKIAKITPNPEFKELLNGMISTIETGGDLRAYLNEKSEEALNTYKLDRQKQVQALGTYSEIYTAILIASPLLLLVTLAIINSIGGDLAGVSVGIIAWISVLAALPLLNIGFMVFINSSGKGL